MAAYARAVRQLDTEEVARRLAAGRARAERIADRSAKRPIAPEVQQAIERAKAALALVLRDVESTTSIRERPEVLRYEDWIVEDALDPKWWVFRPGALDADPVDPAVTPKPLEQLAVAGGRGGELVTATQHGPEVDDRRV